VADLCEYSEVLRPFSHNEHAHHARHESPHSLGTLQGTKEGTK
jgi:hypothetical protein